MNVVIVESPAKAKTINKYLARTTQFWRPTAMYAIYLQRTAQYYPTTTLPCLGRWIPNLKSACRILPAR